MLFRVTAQLCIRISIIFQFYSIVLIRPSFSVCTALLQFCLHAARPESFCNLIFRRLFHKCLYLGRPTLVHHIYVRTTYPVSCNNYSRNKIARCTCLPGCLFVDKQPITTAIFCTRSVLFQYIYNSSLC